MHCENSHILCDSCRHRHKDWWEPPCDNCGGEHSGYEEEKGSDERDKDK